MTHDPPPVHEAEFRLDRFVDAQNSIYDSALTELRAGQKKSHWMWFIFPQLDGLGSSSTARDYAIASLDEARAYLVHPVLGPRILECCRALLNLEGRSATEILGFPDDLKLRSSATLFSIASNLHPEFQAILDRYYDGQPDRRTISLLPLA